MSLVTKKYLVFPHIYIIIFKKFISSSYLYVILLSGMNNKVFCEVINLKRKGWFIPVLVFFTCIIALVFYQNNRNHQVLATTSESSPVLWQEDITDINKLMFSQGNIKITAIRLEDSWHVLDNRNVYEADSVYIYNILSGLVSPKLNSLVDPDPTDMSLYGINDYSRKVTLYDKDDNQYEIVCGDSFDGNHYYVLIDNNIYTLSKQCFDIMNQNIFVWRNKNILSFNESDYSKIYISYNNSLHTLIPSKNNEASGWKCDTLDAHTVEDILTYLKGLRVDDFLVDHPDQTLVHKYGLSQPSVKFTLYKKDGKVVTLSFGEVSKKDNLIYAMLSTSSTIFTLPYVDTPLINE